MVDVELRTHPQVMVDRGNLREGGREGGREGERRREGGREEGREGERSREGGREGGREGERRREGGEWRKENGKEREMFGPHVAMATHLLIMHGHRMFVNEMSSCVQFWDK